MACWNPKRDPEPDKREVTKFKEFLKHKYVDRRFTEDEKKEDSSDEEERKVKK